MQCVYLPSQCLRKHWEGLGQVVPCVPRSVKVKPEVVCSVGPFVSRPAGNKCDGRELWRGWTRRVGGVDRIWFLSYIGIESLRSDT